MSETLLFLSGAILGSRERGVELMLIHRYP